MDQTIVVGGLLMLGAFAVGALATGRWRLEMVRDAHDAKLARWVLGALVLAGGLVLVALQPAAVIRLPAIALAVSGVWLIGTAARLAQHDQTVGIVERAITQSA